MNIFDVSNDEVSEANYREGGDFTHDNGNDCKRGTVVRFIDDKGGNTYKCAACSMKWKGEKYGIGKKVLSNHNDKVSEADNRKGGDFTHDNGNDCTRGTVVRCINNEGKNTYKCIACGMEWKGDEEYENEGKGE